MSAFAGRGFGGGRGGDKDKKKGFKKALDQEGLRKNREETTIRIRKQKVGCRVLV